MHRIDILLWQHPYQRDNLAVSSTHMVTSVTKLSTLFINMQQRLGRLGGAKGQSPVEIGDFHLLTIERMAIFGAKCEGLAKNSATSYAT